MKHLLTDMLLQDAMNAVRKEWDEGVHPRGEGGRFAGGGDKGKEKEPIPHGHIATATGSKPSHGGLGGAHEEPKKPELSPEQHATSRAQLDAARDASRAKQAEQARTLGEHKQAERYHDNKAGTLRAAETKASGDKATQIGAVARAHELARDAHARAAQTVGHPGGRSANTSQVARYATKLAEHADVHVAPAAPTATRMPAGASTTDFPATTHAGGIGDMLGRHD